MAGRIRLAVAKAATRDRSPAEPFGSRCGHERPQRFRLAGRASVGHAAAHALAELHSLRARDTAGTLLMAGHYRPAPLMSSG